MASYAIVALAKQWNLRRIVIDKTGLGAGMASLLVERFGEERIKGFNFSRTSKSALTYQLLGLVNSGRLKMYQGDEAPALIYEEAWKQLKLASYSVPGEGIMNMYVNAADGHDDFLMSIALLGEAIREFAAPAQEAVIVRPRRLYEGESRF